MAAQGANAVLAARNEDKLNRIQSEIKSAGGKVIVVPTDITDRNACNSLVENTITSFRSVDGMILNAGVSMWANFEDIQDPWDSWKYYGNKVILLDMIKTKVREMHIIT